MKNKVYEEIKSIIIDCTNENTKGIEISFVFYNWIQRRNKSYSFIEFDLAYKFSDELARDFNTIGRKNILPYWAKKEDFNSQIEKISQ